MKKKTSGREVRRVPITIYEQNNHQQSFFYLHIVLFFEHFKDNGTTVNEYNAIEMC